MDKIFQLARLCDCYGALLTAHQRQIVAQYVDENCSLAEIAEREGISRQGVRDTLRRAEKQLEAYEQALGLADKIQRHRRQIEKLTKQNPNLATEIESLQEIWNDL
ncbi:MAG: DNA-binding protein [Clostridiales bacterium]|nr:DNA-binding protein [Clostridiales bacterium]